MNKNVSRRSFATGAAGAGALAALADLYGDDLAAEASGEKKSSPWSPTTGGGGIDPLTNPLGRT